MNRNDDPRRLLPLTPVKGLGLGVETPDQLRELFASDPTNAPPVLKIGGRNYVVACDRDRFREKLIEKALKEAYVAKLGGKYG